MPSKATALPWTWGSNRPIQPAMLYHGTPERSLTGVLQNGFLKMSRHHVHRSADEATANAVGSRRGPPVVLAVDAGEMPPRRVRLLPLQ